MIFYYIMRDVVRGSDCSYRPGRTYIDEVYRYPDEARRRADQCNHFCGVAGVCYIVLPHSDTEPLPFDYFEPKPPIRQESSARELEFRLRPELQARSLAIKTWGV